MEPMNLPLHFNSLPMQIHYLVPLNIAMNKTLTSHALTKVKLFTQCMKETNLSAFKVTSVDAT